jgi:transposase-like protein
MDPRNRFCHNQRCWAYGRVGEGHIVIHSQKEHRYRCKRCAKTFSETKGSALYRVHKPHELVLTVVTLMAYGCPVQAIVAAFSLDERTVARWQRESGYQCRRVHEHLVQARGVLLSQVQADELRVRIVGGVLWLASAISVTSRLWLGGVVQVRRDRRLIRSLLAHVRACGAFQSLLLCTDGLSSYPKQALSVFREPEYTGRRGRPRLLLPEGLMIAQAIKRYAQRRVVEVVQRVVVGTEEAVDARLKYTQDSLTAVINTAYIQRVQATFRSRLAPLVRKTRATARQSTTLETGM